MYRLLIIVLLFGCNASSGDLTEKQSSIFFSYLEDVHNVKSSSDTIFYLIIPGSSCQGCAKQIDSIIDRFDFNDLTIITTDNSIMNKVFGFTVLVDSQRFLDRLDIGIRNLALLKTYKSTIIERINLLYEY